MSKNEVNLEFLLKKTIADRLKDDVDADRAEVFKSLYKIYDELGVKSLSIKLPDGAKVATFTVTEPKATDKTDDEKLIEWLEDNGYGDQVLTKTIPAKKVKSLKTGFLGAIGAELVGDQYVTPAGEIVEGIKRVPAAKPKSFSVKYEGGETGRQAVLDAWFSGELAGIDAGDNLPAIETTDIAVEPDDDVDDIIDVEPIEDNKTESEDK